MEKIKVLINKNPFLLLSIIWLIVQIIMFWIFGFKTGWEGLKYQEDARNFLDTGTLNPRHMFFNSYVLTIAFFYKTGLGLKSLIIFQVIFGYFTLYIFYKLSKQLTNNNISAFITTLIFAVSPQIQMWNFHAYTESFFINGLIIFFYLILNFKGNIREYILIILLLIFVAFDRPPGIAIALPAAVYLFYEYFKNHRKTLPLVLLMLVYFIAHITFMLTNRQNFDEFFFATKDQFSMIGGYNALPLPDNESLVLWVYLKAVAIKIFYFFTMWRPYFSFSHNALNVSFSIVYIPAIIGLWKLFFTGKSVFLFLFLIIAGYSALFVLTYVNYHCRYVTTILPFVILAAGIGIDKNERKINNTFAA